MMKFLLIILPIGVTAASSSLEQSAEEPQLGVTTVHGCYASVGELQLDGTNTFNTQSQCATNCQDAGAFVAATKGNSCYCGDTYPPASTLVDDSQCDEPCPGYAMNACGGSGTFTVLNTGVKVDVEDSSSDSTSSETSVASSSTTSALASSTSPTSVVSDVGTTFTAPFRVSSTTAAGFSSNSTSSISTPTGSGSTLPSLSPSVVGNSSASSQHSLSSLGMAILGLGTAFLL